MAIRTNQMPQYGRITRPQGTYLSNPSTAADGSLGGSQGMNPAPGWTGSLGYGTPEPSTGMWWTPQNTNPSVPSGQWYTGVVKGLNNLNRNFELGVNQPLRNAQIPGGPVQFSGPLAFVNQLPTGAQPLQQPSSYVSPFTQKAGNISQTQEWQPGGLPAGVIANSAAMQAGAADGLSNAQVAQQMIQAGYTQKWVEGVGMTWFPGTASQQKYGGAGANGRPDWVDGASLAPGESVVDAKGNRFVGGTPAPDGTSQYAINYANPNAARDTKGRYKWVSDVRKDANGNWVRINRQVLRKVYTRSHLKKAQGRREDQQRQQQQSDAGGTGQNYNQLVNLRVNYG